MYQVRLALMLGRYLNVQKKVWNHANFPSKSHKVHAMLATFNELHGLIWLCFKANTFVLENQYRGGYSSFGPQTPLYQSLSQKTGLFKYKLERMVLLSSQCAHTLQQTRALVVKLKKRFTRALSQCRRRRSGDVTHLLEEAMIYNISFTLGSSSSPVLVCWVALWKPFSRK